MFLYEKISMKHFLSKLLSRGINNCDQVISLNELRFPEVFFER